jgi:branched-chain amino acid transport system ATP-binding protein
MSDAAAALLEVDGLVAGYGQAQVLHGLSIRVAEGGVTALLGANGAGKSTLMKTLAGLLPVSSGRLRFMGQDISQVPSHRRVLDGLVMVPEGRWVFPTLSVAENLRLGAINPRARGQWRQTLDHVYHVFPRLQERERQAAGTLSGGEQQMLAIGRGLMSRPRLMLLDEPTLGLAPTLVDVIFELLATLRGEGRTLLVVEQNARRALALADRGYVLRTGRIVATGSGAEMAATADLFATFLGDTA